MTDHRMQLAGVVQQWDSEAVAAEMPEQLYIATQAFREGADQMLQACCDAIYKYEGEPLCGGTAEWLRNAMSPKPPSLKEQALAALDDCSDRLDAAHENTIRCALEAMTDD